MNTEKLIAKLEGQAEYLHDVRQDGAAYIIKSLERELDGFVIVPVEPTDEMIGKALRVANENIIRIGPDTFEEMYKAMLSTLSQDGDSHES